MLDVFEPDLHEQTRPVIRWVPVTLAALFVALGVGLGVGLGSTSGASSHVGSFSWLRSTPSASWARLGLPGGLGTISVPPGFKALDPDAVDPGTVALARFSPNGAYLGYLNVTQRPNSEQLHGWTDLRLEHLRADTASSAHLDAGVEAVHTAASERSCVIDDYVTRVGHRAYREVACFVVSGSAASVVVAATPSNDPAGLWTDLERVVAAYPSA